MKNKAVIYLLPFILLTSCVLRTQNIMDATTVFLQIKNPVDCINLEAQLIHGSIEIIEPCIYKIYYSKAKGGTKQFLGKMIKDQTPQATNFLIFSREAKEVHKISYKEIMKLDYKEVNGEKIYQLKLK